MHFKEAKVMRAFFDVDSIPHIEVGSIFTVTINGVDLEIFANYKERIRDRLLVMGYYYNDGRWYTVDTLFIANHEGEKSSIVLSPRTTPSFVKDGLVTYYNKMLAKISAIEDEIIV